MATDASERVWGVRVRDWADLIEPLFRPAYDRILGELDIRPGLSLLDVGCGTGMAARLASERGASVAGLDSSGTSLELARERTPEAEFREGDLANLPWSPQSFDIVTGFNSFQFASDIVAGLREARRVTKPGGKVSMMVWSLDEDCESMVTIDAVRRLMPPPEGPPEPAPLGSEGRVEQLMSEGGLKPLKSGHVICTFEFPDVETALRGFLSSGVMVAAERQLGEETVREAITASFAGFERDGRIVQKNDYRYVIAEA